ncbi:MAG: type II and III secretion system protein [Planctomycetes bacterium]|nr:type II and III secretion system protein [Planctomycetota bacterium]
MTLFHRPDLRRRRASRVIRSLGLAATGLGLTACAAGSPSRKFEFDPKTEVVVFDPSGVPTDGSPIDAQVAGLGNAPAPAVDWSSIDAALRSSAIEDRPAVAAVEGTERDTSPQDQDEEKRRAAARLRIAFGDTILINDDGTVTKQYFLSESAGRLFVNLLLPIGTAGGTALSTPQATYGGDQLGSVLGRMLGKEHKVDLVFVDKFEAVEDTALRVQPTTRAVMGAAARHNSLVLVTAKAEALAAFEKALDLFYGNIPQVQIEVKVVEYTTSDSLAIGVVPVNSTTPTFENNASGRLVRNIISDFAASGFSSSGGSSAGGIISLGGIHDSWELAAALQLLEAQNIADVKSQPRMVVRNGGTATVATRTSQPFPVAKIVNQTVTSTDIAFKDVGITMDIRPDIAGTETVVLNIYVSVSSITGFVDSDPIPTPIVSSREAATAVHLREGQTTVIGGLVAESNFDSERKIPLLGDIPLLGVLFRSTSTQREKTVLEFHITPRILTSTRRTGSSVVGS